VTEAKPFVSRLLYLDTVKGFLVILMVIYHALNYTNQYHLGFRYLSFLPLSFILITGFLLSRVYAARYAASDPLLVRRLLLRGIRLAALFTVLNVVAQYVRSPAYGRSVGVTAFFEHGYEVFVAGGSRIAVFEVLLPIAYLLLLAPALIAMAHRHSWFLPAASALLVVGCAFLDFCGLSFVNLGFVSIGVFGMLIGRWCPNPSGIGRFLWLTVIAYAAYFPLGLLRGWVFLVQLLGAVVALALICAVSVVVGENGWWRQRIIRIGQYSLVAYIAQIGILQILSRFVGRPDPLSQEAIVLFAGTLILMTAIVECTVWLRSGSPLIDRTYRAVFA
jgi:peptidoglycan/LPS O-acetylase OafA/YrhL